MEFLVESDSVTENIRQIMSTLCAKTERRSRENNCMRDSAGMFAISSNCRRDGSDCSYQFDHVGPAFGYHYDIQRQSELKSACAAYAALQLH